MAGEAQYAQREGQMVDPETVPSKLVNNEQHSTKTAHMEAFAYLTSRHSWRAQAR